MVLLLFFCLNSFAAENHMPTMPKLKPHKIFEVKDQNISDQIMKDRGFGDAEEEVRMMNLMMVEGSGLEGMDMSLNTQNAHHAPTRGNGFIVIREEMNPKVGVNEVIFLMKDPNGKPVIGEKIQAEIYMNSSMDGNGKGSSARTRQWPL